MLPQEIIRKKRDGVVLSEPEISEFIAGLTNGQVTDAQAAAFAMAVFFRGMTMPERVVLTTSMMLSGNQIEWSDSPGPVLDKHSTGGIGDNVSLMLAPAVAACGGYVPMISGRGLGHTGGTLDKLDSIPGYASQPDIALFRKVVRETGTAIIGQTSDLAPADKKLYSIRDVTATVESIPLITASILSKKLAAGLQGLVMDVKTGSGAFMPTLEGSRELAQSLADVATGAGLPTTALITDMDEPLASAAGNAVEVMNAIEYLTGTHRDPRLHQVVLALGADMLLIGGLVQTLEEGFKKLDAAISSGAAAERFQRMVTALGGPADLMDHPQNYLPKAQVIVPVLANANGIVQSIATREIGLAVVALGGGRTRAEDGIDHSVGFTKLISVGTSVSNDTVLGFVHARTQTDAEAASAHLRRSYTIGDATPIMRPLIHDRFQGKGL
ncbi:MAG: thymidine phosphorylase [Alphaproteobacteria bacterium]|nr:thymidine phosphorylase [Beijerinckiaceae bacterium]NBQ38989.1 thymidine phosphorylase [Alphaproteobacteria bacterium]